MQTVTIRLPFVVVAIAVVTILTGCKNSVEPDLPGVPTLASTTTADGATGVSINPTLTWDVSRSSLKYRPLFLHQPNLQGSLPNARLWGL
jgi:hypothetical protein